MNIDDKNCLVGLDMGSVNVHAVLLTKTKRYSWITPLRGKPLEVIASLFRDEIAPLATDQIQLAITGQGRDLLKGLVEFEPVNEVVATASAARAISSKAQTVIDIGGQFSKWISLVPNSSNVADFATNGLCAAGGGAFLEQQASRLGLSVEKLGDQAFCAKHGATVAGRCSVFAKSDMIHLQQKGTPTQSIAYGLCLALVRTFKASVMKGRAFEAPVVMAGGGAESAGLIRAFIEISGLAKEDFIIPDEPLLVGADGAAKAASNAPGISISSLLKVDRVKQSPKKTALLEPLIKTSTDSPPTTPRPSHGRIPGPGLKNVFLGVDVGSVSTNLVLITPSGELVDNSDIYLRTKGRPLDAMAEGLSILGARFGNSLTVMGVGATGSGRHLASRVIGADVVRNEITAQLVSSSHYFPNVDTVFEIGGQDSKYMGTRDGKLSGFEMNKICSAGTGSFLEEQADGLGISIIDEFSSIAFDGNAPWDLGGQCTVFMDTQLRRALREGASLPNICAGLAYSVSRNYLEKVVARRPVGDCIVFQGGTASNASVVAALSKILNKKIHVHPHNGVSGAIGASLLASREYEQVSYKTQFLGFDSCQGAESSTFECKSCPNRCQVNKISIRGRVAYFGDACEKFSEKDESEKAIQRPFDELFSFRKNLLFQFLDESKNKSLDDAPKIQIPLASTMYQLAPMFANLLSHLGYHPIVDKEKTIDSEENPASDLPAEVCLPIKIAAAQVRGLVKNKAPIFSPAIAGLPTGPEEESVTCHYTSEWPNMLPQELQDKIIRPQFTLGDGKGGLAETTRALAKALNVSKKAASKALNQGQSAQLNFENQLLKKGADALKKDFDRAVVVIGRPYNIHDPQANLNLARYLEKLGMAAIPMDMLPLDNLQLDSRWDSVPWHFPRMILKAALFVQKDPRLFPVVVSSFGCGVDGFMFRHLEEMLSDRPRLLLEFDEHRAEAGLVTRLEAFYDEIDDHLKSKNKQKAKTTIGTLRLPKGQRVFVPHLSEFSKSYRGALKSAGYDPVPMPMPSEKTKALGESISTGRECHPFVMVGGQLMELLESGDFGPNDFILNPYCDVPCLLKQYGDAYRIIQDRMGISNPQIWDISNGKLDRVLGAAGLMRFYEGNCAIELLITLARRVRPYANDPNAPLDCMKDATDKIEEALAQKRSTKPILKKASKQIWEMAVNGRPGDLPVIGVTGDLYTRIVDESNAHLFDRLEEMGNEVWTSPSMAAASPLADRLDVTRFAGRKQLKKAAYKRLTATLTNSTYRSFLKALPPQVANLVGEPTPLKSIKAVEPYLGEHSNWLLLLNLAKFVDFFERGCAGVINVVGINCMIGPVISAIIPQIQKQFNGAPLINIAYGNEEGPSQRVLIETFSQQVGRRS